MLRDLSDERRAAKPWLPTSDLDVTEGRVIPGPIDSDRRPMCEVHGAMNCIAPPSTQDMSRIYRCSECGVGALWWPTNSPTAKRAFTSNWDARVRPTYNAARAGF